MTTTTSAARQIRPEPSPYARERDRALYNLMLRFRDEPRADLWWLMLEMVRPMLETRLSRYRGRLAFIGRDDLFQEMALILRESALTMPLASDHFLERRLVMRTAYLASRKLRWEAARQERLDPLELLDEEEEDEDDES